LENGIAGIVLMGLFVSWLLLRSFAVWVRSPPGASDIDWMLIRAATISITLLLLHSLVDYPLRTSAITGIMAFFSALLIEPPYPAEEPAPAKVEKREPVPHRGRKRIASPVPSTAASPGAYLPPSPAGPAPSPQTQPGQHDQRWGSDINWPKEWSRNGKPGSPGEGGSQGSS
jgi:hypothetical protein